jgi:adenylate kinase family enzyme
MDHLGKKIVIVGVSASGKSTFARKIAEKIKLPLIHVDTIIWKPGWQPIGNEETAKKLREIGSEEEWIIEGYITKEVCAFIFDRVDTIIYLDYPPLVATLRYLKRWIKHRKNPRPELTGSPEKFDWEFMKRVWTKEEATTLNKFLSEVKDPHKIIKLTSIRQANAFFRQ